MAYYSVLALYHGQYVMKKTLDKREKHNSTRRCTVLTNNETNVVLAKDLRTEYETSRTKDNDVLRHKVSNIPQNQGLLKD